MLTSPAAQFINIRHALNEQSQFSICIGYLFCMIPVNIDSQITRKQLHHTQNTNLLLRRDSNYKYFINETIWWEIVFGESI